MYTFSCIPLLIAKSFTIPLKCKERTAHFLGQIKFSKCVDPWLVGCVEVEHTDIEDLPFLKDAWSSMGSWSQSLEGFIVII